MDVTGLKPATAAGGYFHCTIWYWAPLWTYVSRVAPDILTEKDITLGHSNSGHKISAAKARAIGRRLNEMIAAGKTEAYVKKFRGKKPNRTQSSRSPSLAIVKKMVKALGAAGEPGITVEIVQAFADFCSGSGGFEIS